MTISRRFFAPQLRRFSWFWMASKTPPIWELLSVLRWGQAQAVLSSRSAAQQVSPRQWLTPQRGRLNTRASPASQTWSARSLRLKNVQSGFTDSKRKPEGLILILTTRAAALWFWGARGTGCTGWFGRRATTLQAFLFTDRLSH